MMTYGKVGSYRLIVSLVLCGAGSVRATTPVVEVEDVVTSYTPANNGAGPLWCYGSTCIARQGDDVYASVIETGKDIPPLANTRWQLWHRNTDGWKLVQHEQDYRQREPCPIAVFHEKAVFLSMNPSTQPPGTKYGLCHPQVLEFDPAESAVNPRVHEPAWSEGTHFTDHSYRGFAADGANGELLLLNVNAKTGQYFISFRDRRSTWHAKGTLAFPIRACYPQVALRDRAAHVLAIGDIVEPVKEWKDLKAEKTKSSWDYVFRRLFYTFTPDIEKTPFIEPVEVDTVEKTAGHITNLDLYMETPDTAHLLYLKRPHVYEFIRDKYFPGQPMPSLLEYIVVKAGKVISRRTLAQTPPDGKALAPAYARFVVRPQGELDVIVAGTAADNLGKTAFGNHIARLVPGSDPLTFTRIPMEHPFRNFFTNTPRGGSKPSDIIDLFGTADDEPKLRYARIRLK